MVYPSRLKKDIIEITSPSNGIKKQTFKYQ